MQISDTSSWVVYGVLLLISLFVVYMIGFLRGGRAAQQRSAAPAPVRRSFLGGLTKLLIIVILTVSALALLFYTALLRSFNTFTGKQLVAVVYCRPIATKDYNMEMKLIPIVNNAIHDTTTFLLKGDQWALEGNIIKWESALNFLGLKTMYRLTRVRGRYLSATKEAYEPGSIYALIDEEHAKRWRWLYEYGETLPFVDAVYGNTVYTYPVPKKQFKVYVTTSGYMVEGGESNIRPRRNIFDFFRRETPAE